MGLRQVTWGQLGGRCQPQLPQGLLALLGPQHWHQCPRSSPQPPGWAVGRIWPGHKIRGHMGQEDKWPWTPKKG